MKTIIDLVLALAVFSSVFFVAGLANVPRRVRFTVASIGPAFLLTLLLHLRNSVHVDWGLGAIACSVIASAIIGFHYTHKAALSREEKFELAKRFGVIFALSAVSVAIVATLIVHLDKPGLDRSGRPNPETSIVDSLFVEPTQAETADQKKWDDLK
jgi:hypothetical protein